MEKNRWSLIFIGLCLALVFSVSPVEAQMHHLCERGAFCDQDSDDVYRDHARCVHCEEPFDPNDHDCEIPSGTIATCFEPESEPEPVKVFICHFKQTLKHCGGLGGGEIEVVFDSKSYLRHLEHGDCINNDDVGVNYFNASEQECVNHCLAGTAFDMKADEALCVDGIMVD